MAKDFLHEARIVELSNDEIKELLGSTYNRLKHLAEAKKSDPDLEQMKEALKNYVEDNYGAEQKKNKAVLKAAENQADLRGIKWKRPEGID